MNKYIKYVNLTNMNNDIIKNIGVEYKDYLKDESRQIGSAESISFPETEDHVKEILSLMNNNGCAVTVQGGRTGIAAGAVPCGGHILNLSRMNKITSFKFDENSGSFYITVQPGVLLSELRETLISGEFDTENWTQNSIEALDILKKKGPHFFSPDPTETSASIGGMVACNASGARSFFYGPTRRYVDALRIVLADGSSLCLERGKQKASGRSFGVTPDSGQTIEGSLPSYHMPDIKNASGYFVENNMNLIDLFIGSEGTLGVVTEIQLRLLPLPEYIWGIVAFFPAEKSALNFVKDIRYKCVGCADKGLNNLPVALEHFNSNALNLLREQKEKNSAFSEIPNIPSHFHTALYMEFHGSSEYEIESMILNATEVLENSGGSEEATWVATNPDELGKLHYFRHAIPEAVNLLIDERRQKCQNITKLGTDMAVPDNELDNVINLYNKDLEESGLDSVMFGHIGDNHIHVNILPNNMEQCNEGKRLYHKWACEVIRMGGTVSAEHGIGKLKTSLLKEMYGQQGIEEMYSIKKLFDPGCILNRQNLFE